MRSRDQSSGGEHPSSREDSPCRNDAGDAGFGGDENGFGGHCLLDGGDRR